MMKWFLVGCFYGFFSTCLLAQGYKPWVAQLWHAPKDSVPVLLERVSFEWNKKPLGEAIIFWEELAQQAEKQGTTYIVLEVYKAESAYFFDLNRYIEAVQSTEKRLAFAERKGLPIEEGLAHWSKGNIYRFMKKPDKALRSFFKALHIFEKQHSKFGICKIYMELGNLYCFTKPQQAREYALKAKALQNYSDDKRATVSNLNTIALTYQEEGKNVEALQAFEIALQKAKEYQDAEWVGIISGNMAMIYLRLKQYEKALAYLYIDLQASRDDGNTANVYLGIVDIYFAQKQYEQAKPYLDSALKWTEKVKRPETWAMMHNQLHKYYQKQKNFEKAYEHTRKLMAYRDTVLQNTQIAQIAQVQAQYDFDKQEEQITHLHDRAVLQRWVNAGLVTIAMLLGLLLFFILRNYVRSKQLNKTLHAQKEEILAQNEELHQSRDEITIQRDFIETQNLKIIDSIKTALTIQTAILPTEAELKQLLGEYFVLYMPRDIVSGDFYWAKQVAGKTLVVVADCTGHGVAGAFMSLIAYHLWEEIVYQHELNPAEMLKKLHPLVRTALHQNEDDDSVAIGLDMAVLLLEAGKEQTHVTFAGAKRPLYYAETGKENSIQILPATRKSIGGMQNERIQFENQTLNLPAGSVLYMGSDGLADQCNAQRKRIGEAKLLQVLSEIGQASMPEQKNAIEQMLKTYMEGTTQRDDVLLLGVRI